MAGVKLIMMYPDSDVTVIVVVQSYDLASQPMHGALWLICEIKNLETYVGEQRELGLPIIPSVPLLL